MEFQKQSGMSLVLPIDGSFVFGTRKSFIPKKLINEGGFGSVWLLDDERLVCKFALKGESLENEHKTMEAIHSRVKAQPHLKEYIVVPRLIEHGTCIINNERHEYIVMERFGSDLSSIKDLHFTTELNRIYAILRSGLKILKGLYVMHVYLKLVHGDVKPSNFLFTEKDKTVVSTDSLAFIDLGLARPVRDKPIQTSGINGTRSYASIHVQKKYLPTPRCDLESLGYMMLGLIDNVLPWNKEIKNYMKRKQAAASSSSDNEENETAETKIQKENIALGQKRELKQRIHDEAFATDGEMILAEYLYMVYNMGTVPDISMYKMLCKSFYSTLKRLQSIALEAQQTASREFQKKNKKSVTA